MTDRIGGFDKKLGHTRTNTDDTKLEKPTPRANALSEQTSHTRTQNSERNSIPPTLELPIFSREKKSIPPTPGLSTVGREKGKRTGNAARLG